MKLKRMPVVFVSFFVLIAGSFSSVAATELLPTIELERAVHFLTPGGDDVVVQAGRYEVEAAEEWLRLIPQGRDRVQAILVQTNIFQLDGLLNVSQAQSQQVGEDQHLLTLLLPDGTMFEAEGSYSGVRSRGLLFRKRFSRRLPGSSVTQLRKRPARVRQPRLQQPKPSTPIAPPSVPKRFSRRPATPSGVPTPGTAPRITKVTGPDANLVEQMLAAVNCGSFEAVGLASQCESVKTDLSQRLKGYRVVGTGTPQQRVSLYLAQGCPAPEDFRTRVAQEVTESVRNRLGSTFGALASQFTSFFDGYWFNASNVIIGNTGAFESALIAPANAQGVNVAAPAGSTCSNGVSLPHPTSSVTSPSSGTTAPSDIASNFLAHHHAVRASVLPAPATPLAPFTWNQEIANVAQGWANQCVFGHNAQRGVLGENLYLSSGSPTSPQISVI